MAPAGLLDEIIEARRYTEAKQLWDQNRKRSELPDSVWIDRVAEIDLELAGEALKKLSDECAHD